MHHNYYFTIALDIIIIIVFTSSYYSYASENLVLLTSTLRVNEQTSCVDQPIDLRCPPGTNIIIDTANYTMTHPLSLSKKNANDPHCEYPYTSITSISNTNQLSRQPCQWVDSIQYSLLQRALENCRKKEYCRIEAPSDKFELDGCNILMARTQVRYKCRPPEFNSKMACENDPIKLECEANSRVAIFSASYGRTEYQSAMCPQAQGVAEETCLLKYATEMVFRLCHGKRSCMLNTNSSRFENPCQPKSRVYLKVTFKCVPRTVISEEYEEPGKADEFPLIAELEGQEEQNELDNVGSLAPSPNVANTRESNDSKILSHQLKPTYETSDASSDKERIYVYIIGGISGIALSVLVLTLVKIFWNRICHNRTEKYHTSNQSSDLPHLPSFADEICQVDADIGLQESMTAVTVIPSIHHNISPSEVVRYGKDGMIPRSLSSNWDNRQFYD